MDTLPHEKPILEYTETLKRFKDQNRNTPVFSNEIEKLEAKLDQVKQRVYSQLTPWQRVTISRHPQRPHSSDYIRELCDSFIELSGDRTFRDDRSIIGGLAEIAGQKFVLLGQEKGKDTETRVEHNFGMLSPEGYRKALRLMRLAEKFSLPVVSLVDTPGAYPGLEAEERGQAWAIATNLREMASVATPIVVVIIGEASSGGAIGTAMGDSIGMLEHSYYSVISPEGCASILWKDASRKEEAAEALKLNAENLLEFGIVDTIIPEPLGGAHHDPQQVMARVKCFILEESARLASFSGERLLQLRYEKFRRLGVYESHCHSIEKASSGDQRVSEL